jgi:hypothetical protein
MGVGDGLKNILNVGQKTKNTTHNNARRVYMPDIDWGKVRGAGNQDRILLCGV